MSVLTRADCRRVRPVIKTVEMDPSIFAVYEHFYLKMARIRSFFYLNPDPAIGNMLPRLRIISWVIAIPGSVECLLPLVQAPGQGLPAGQLAPDHQRDRGQTVGRIVINQAVTLLERKLLSFSYS